MAGIIIMDTPPPPVVKCSLGGETPPGIYHSVPVIQRFERLTPVNDYSVRSHWQLPPLPFPLYPLPPLCPFLSTSRPFFLATPTTARTENTSAMPRRLLGPRHVHDDRGHVPVLRSRLRSSGDGGRRDRTGVQQLGRVFHDGVLLRHGVLRRRLLEP